MLPIIKKLIAYNFTPNANTPVYIVIHDTGNPNANALAHYNYFNGGDRQASAHFFIDDRTIIQTVEIKDKSWHCGDGKGVYGISNNNSIGIEMCINTDGDYNKAIQNVIDLTIYLMRTYNIGIDKVVRHYDASRKVCPKTMSANNWAIWNDFKARVEAQYKAETAPAPAPQEPLFRVRKSWVDVKSQLGAYKNLDSAKALADASEEYTVYDESGKAVYTKPAPAPIEPPKPAVPAMPIMGAQEFTVEQMATLLIKRNPEPKIGGMNVLAFVNLYLEEGKAEGVRGDIAFCQSILETHAFGYGGDVKPEQFNFAGIGATGNGVAGNSFESQRIGVRAQIQHLKAYGSTDVLVNADADPRFKYVKRGIAPTFNELASKWALDEQYAEKIYKIFEELKNTTADITLITPYILKVEEPKVIEKVVEKVIEKAVEVPVEKIVEVPVKLNLTAEEKTLLETLYNAIAKVLKGAN